MTKAKKLLAVLLAVLTFVSVTAIGVSAEEATTPAAGSSSTTTTETPAQKAYKELFVEGATKKTVSNRIEITAPAASSEISIADNGKVTFKTEGTPIAREDGKYTLAFEDAHKPVINEKGEVTKYTNEVKTTVDVIVKGQTGADELLKDIEVVFNFAIDSKKDDGKGHRYDKKIGETVKPTYDEVGYDVYECVCGAQARLNKVDKLPGEVTKVKCGPDISVAKKGVYKLEPNIESYGEVDYKVSYKTSNDKVATVNEKGEITGVALGKAVITCTLTFTKAGKTVTLEDTVNVKVTYSFIQWILVAAEAIITGSVFVWDLILDALGLMK